MNKKQDKFTFETIVEVVKRVSEIKPVVVYAMFNNTVYNEVRNYISRNPQPNDYRMLSFEELAKNTVKSQTEQIVSFNSEVAEIQQFLQDRNYLKMLDKATPEEQKDIVNTLLQIGAKSVEMDAAEKKGQKGRKNKAESDLNAIVEKNKENETVLTVTQSYGTILPYDGKAEQLQEKFAAEWRNIAASYGIS